jgi:hypothetical protein
VFVYNIGQAALTRSTVVQALQSVGFNFPHDNGGGPKSKFGGQSMRRGGASAAFRSGVSIEVIKVMGRWRSDAIYDYLKTDASLRKAAMLNMKPR